MGGTFSFNAGTWRVSVLGRVSRARVPVSEGWLTVHVKAPFRPARDERPPCRAARGLRCRHIDSFNLLMPLRAQGLPAWLGLAPRHLAALICDRRWSHILKKLFKFVPPYKLPIFPESFPKIVNPKGPPLQLSFSL